MLARRLIAAPLLALVAMLLVGAIIDSGQRARMARAAGPTQVAVPADPSLAAEARRVRQAVDAAQHCTGASACTPEVSEARVRTAALDIDRWPSDRRFQVVRSTLRAQLLVEARLLDQRSADDVNGHRTYASRARVRKLERELQLAKIDSAKAQRSAGLLSRATFDALIVELTA